MAGVNKHILVGHLGKDPEVLHSQAGAKIVKFSVAVTETWRDKNTGERREATSWHNIVILNEQIGEIATKYLKKGSQCYLEGEVQTRSYEKGGEKRFITETVMKPYRGVLTLLDRAERAPAPDENSYTKSGPRDLDDEVPF